MGSESSNGSGDDSMASGEPGFGDSIGGDLSLPSLVDEEPVYSASSVTSSSSSSSDGGGGSSGGGSNSGNEATGDSQGQVASNTGSNSDQGEGTRAQGGMDPDWGTTDTMTTAERVAVLDKQLEESTGVFDAIIREEQRQQRASRREQGANTQSSDDSGTEQNSSGRNPYEADEQGGYGSVGGGMGGRTGGAPDAPAVYEAPEDIPSGNDDDIVARQLREAAMREPDPDIREALWNEYRKYKGIEIPEE